LLFIVSGCAPVEYEVTIELNPGEAGEVTGSGTYEEGEEVSVEANPAEGFGFLAWEIEGEKVSTEKS